MTRRARPLHAGVAGLALALALGSCAAPHDVRSLETLNKVADHRAILI